MALAPRAIPLPARAARGLSDQRLAARVASGDDQAFEEIFDRYGPALLSFCTHMLGSREWGEDALQLTFVAAFRALRRGRCDGALRPWLYAIARNRCLSELRARREIPDSEWVSADRPALDGPASLFARREQLGEVVEDIQRLPADQRAALVLFELGDQSHEEIASVLGVRRDRVKALIFQAREGLFRGRRARESACSEVRERLANVRGKAPARGIVRAHIDRCEPCQEFEREVRRQRAALALVLPVALSGQLKALVLSSGLGHGSVGAGAASFTGTGGAGLLSGATSAASGSGVLAGPGTVAAGAAASATGSAATAVAGGAVSAAAGAAAPTMVASALGTDAIASAGALTSSVSVASVAKLATVIAVAVGVGGVTRSALTPSPRPQVSFLAGQPAQRAPLRSPLQPLVSGIVDPLAGATQPGSQPGAGATAPAGAPRIGAASAPVPSSNAAPSSSATSAVVSAPSPPSAGGPASPTGTTYAPAASAPGNGSATTTAPSSGNSTTTAGTTTTTAPSSAGSGTSTSTTTTASSPTTASTGSSSGSPASHGTSGASSGASGNGPGDSTGQAQSSGGGPGGGVTHSNRNGPPITPPGCVNNPAPGCTKKTPRS